MAPRANELNHEKKPRPAQSDASSSQDDSSQSVSSSAIDVEKPSKAHQTQQVSGSNKTSSSSSEKIGQPVGFIRQYELAELVRAYSPNFDESLLNRAYVFSMKAHGGQMRKSGDPYFTHPLAVAAILTELRADPATVITALLHDTVEDTDTSLKDIENLFGKEIATMVDGVTKLSQIELRSEASKQAENFRKLVMAMAEDVRVLLVKLADRLHNMRTLHHFTNVEKQKRIARETLEIYAPLSGRIGIQRFRDELEDLSFSILNPEAYQTIDERLNELQSTTVQGVVDLAHTLRERLELAGIKAEVMSREKKPYSIWRKMDAKKTSFEDLADIYAFRVIVETIEDCYRALGVIHTRWRMIGEEFDDYISTPKPNNYQSIHTAVIGPPTKDGGRQRIEVQIRTHTMHDHAERGAAAHWHYKEKGSGKENLITRNMPAKTDYIVPKDFDFYHTPRGLKSMFVDGDVDEALEYAKLELFQDQVFCFTPKGLVVALPTGATGLDFAYDLHTDIGDSCIGVMINGRSRPLRTPLMNGDVVTILRSDNAQPPGEWEKIATTGRARAAIRRRLKKLEFAEQISMGRSIAESVFSGAKLDFSLKAIKSGLGKLKLKSPNEVLARIGRGELSVHDLIEAVYPGAVTTPVSETEVRAASEGRYKEARQVVSGITPGYEAHMAQCCLPVPGDRIVGIKDIDEKIRIHTIFCKKLAKDDPPQDRWIDLRWRKNIDDYRAVSAITMAVKNDVGALSEIAAVVARYGVSISNIEFIHRTPDFFDLKLDLSVATLNTLNQLLTALRATAPVITVERHETDDSNEY